MLSAPTAQVSTIHFHGIKRIYSVPYQTYKAKLKNELTPSQTNK